MYQIYGWTEDLNWMGKPNFIILSWIEFLIYSKQRHAKDLIWIEENLCLSLGSRLLPNLVLRFF